MKKGGKGGSLTQSGIAFENTADFLSALQSIPGYEILKSTGLAGTDIYYEKQKVARFFKKNEFYDYLQEEGIDWKRILSKRLIPDQTLLVIIRDTLCVIEVKFQQVSGSVDEKLQTCDFKRKQYIKLVQPLGLRVEYIYVLNDWFKKPEYKDTLDYIISVNCFYHFNTIPLRWFGLPG